MNRIENFITQLVLHSELDIDEVLEQAIEKFEHEFSEDDIRLTMYQVMEDLPELN